MKFKKSFTLSTLLLSIFIFGQKKNEFDLSVFPKAKAGFEEKIIPIDGASNNIRIELFVSTTKAVDTCNKFTLLGNFEQKTLRDWRYNYYEFKTKGQVEGEYICPYDNNKVEKVIYAQSKIIDNYDNSPVIVYIPNGYSLEYKIWKTNDKLLSVQ